MAVSPSRIYLDYNASAPLRAEAREALVAALSAANPSSVHREGREARALVEDARRSVADLVGANPGEVTFTSGASESANMALSSAWLVSGSSVDHGALAVLETDHAAFLEGGRFDAGEVTRLRVDANGVLDPESLADWIDGLGGRRGLLAVDLANSETGTLQDIEQIARQIEGRNVTLVVDAAQCAGRIPLDFARVPADAMILSAHKLGGPKGIGAIVLKSTSTRPYPLIRGGGQEKGRRSGTEAVAEIAGFGAAARGCLFDLRNDDGRMVRLRDALDAAVTEASPRTKVLGDGARRLPNTSAYLTPGLKSETAQIAIDLAGIAVSAGSACSSGKVGRSHVVEAMVRAGLDVDAADGALRVSFGFETSEAELMRFATEYTRLALRVGGEGGYAERAA
ncbi:cysteine desulfurase [Fulvimarina endophytica]|uniref:Cysteine desulfurase n=1 Tax=Fulvimarina endophytica TaxID=2293836 RepID=A0A371XAW8_9HYPH|nr:cysteine desulfurase family protein [Fulvimarina endophytica]RFC66388.1 cysteine desulfurase [Fulvimarina endophytica]